MTAASTLAIFRNARLVAGALVAVVMFSPTGASWAQTSGNQLKGITQVQFLIEHLDEENKRCGLTEE
jgi:hypothetical protein